MRTVMYRKHSDSFKIPRNVTNEKQIDFLISAYKRVLHNRNTVDLSVLLVAINDYWNYPPYTKKANLEKAVLLYGYISKQNRFIERVCNQTISDFPFLFEPGVRFEQIQERTERLQEIRENARYSNL